MALQPGTRLGPYQVESAIGAGGMGEVYKATDTRLNRTVAIKVLPPHFADDADMRQRFEREAQTIAGLNHPHICTLHDVGEQDGTRFIVMEYVEGETLADRLARGPLPVEDALQVAGEIVDALDRAHRQNIVHRDLKPANIMLARSGATRQGSGKSTSHGTSQTKLLDFGLAKWAASDRTPSAQSTRLDVTAQGTILGTLQYMAPEQVEGKEADQRTDIFAFGAVLYEMLTGKKAFEGKSQASLIGAIMKAEPRPISHTQPLTPAALEHIVARCLVKDPEERWQDAHSVKLKLRWIARNRGTAIAVEAPRRRWIDVALPVAIVVLLASVSVPAYLYWRGSAQPDAVQFRHTITGLSETDFAASPDGRSIAFVAKPDSSGAASLYIRPVAAVASVKLAGTDNATQPFWSPDNQFIAYLSGGKLKKVPASGGAPQDVCDAPDAMGGAWSPNQGGTIVFGSTKGLFTVSAEGGKATPMTEVAQGETGHFWPSFLPDGRHVVYLAWSEDAANRVLYAGTLNSKERTKLTAVESNPVYAASAGSGYLFFHRKATLFAQPFDAAGLRFTAEPVHVADDVSSGPSGHGNFAVSQNGVLLYFQGVGAASTTGRGRTGPEQFAWVDRTGGRNGSALDAGSYGDMDLSPDGKLIAITKQDPGAPTADIWVIDWEKAVSHRVTSDAGDAVDPVWSPDGTRIAFTSWRKGNADIYVKNANGVGEETALLESAANESVEDWSRDGKYIAFEFGKDSFQDIYALPLEGGKPGKAFPVVQGHYQKNEPQFSKDGKWLAYASDENETSRFQVYVISFPSGDLKQQISTDGGGQPRWSWDGKQVFYRTLDNRYMSVDLKLGAKIEHTSPRVLGTSPTTVASSGDPTRHMWSVASDGRVLLRVAVGSTLGGGTGSPTVTPTFTPAGQGSAAASTRSNVTSGLTALLHWTSALPKGSK
jgi:Tol biopolymer transport system component/tRNA A-37 threonylcarbamoyl transferase component Bud32